MQLLGQLRESGFAIDCHIGDDIALDDVVLVRNTLELRIGLNVEKFC